MPFLPMKKWKSAILTAISLLFSIKLWLEIPLMKKVFESESIGTTSTTRKNGALMTHNCSNRHHSAVTWYLSNLWNYIFYPHSQSTNPNSLSLIGYVIFFSWYSAHFIHFSLKQPVFRCVLASLYEGLSVRRSVGPSVGRSVGPSVGRSVRL